MGTGDAFGAGFTRSILPRTTNRNVGRQSFEIRESADLDLILPIRWRNLYPEKPVDIESSREVDEATDTIHFVAFAADTPFGCVSLLNEPVHECELRIRWLAVDENQRRNGTGNKLVNACLQKAQDLGIWCNVRLQAVKLYEHLGFVKISELFELPEIGPHFLMRHIP